MDKFDKILCVLGIPILCLMSFWAGKNSVDPKLKVETKTIHIRTTTTTTQPWAGIQCMVNGAVIKTDLSHAEEAGCQ